jgi:hypothetical protein
MSKQLVDPDIVKETLQAEAAFSDDEEKDACQVRNFDDCLRSRDSGCSPFVVCSYLTNYCSFHHRASRPPTAIALGRGSLTRAC